LERLSQKARLSPFHLQRTFKAVVGVTPRQYLEACRLETLKKQFRSGNSLTEAIYDAGFGSNSRVYERVDTRLGMTPTEYRAGGSHVSISYVTIQSPIGLMMIGATDRGLCFVQFGDSRLKLLQMLRTEYPAAALAEMKQPYPEQFGLWVQALIRHLSGDRRSRNCVSIPGLDIPPVHSLRRSPILLRGGAWHSESGRQSGGGAGLRFKQSRHCSSLPSSDSRKRRDGRLSLGCRSKAYVDRSGKIGKSCRCVGKVGRSLRDATYLCAGQTGA
jgi:AraC-like DNA-binding protein